MPTLFRDRTSWSAWVRSVAAVVLLWLLIASEVSAHAALVATTPADGSILQTAPSMVSLRFSEPVTPTSMRLTKPDLAVMALDQVLLRGKELEVRWPADSDPGTYILSWRVVSEDGHPVAGSVVISIGKASPTRPIADQRVDLSVRGGLWIGKVMLYLGLVFGIGGAFAIHWFAGGHAHGSRLIGASLAIGAAGIAISAVFQGLDTVGASIAQLNDFSILSAGLQTSFGRTLSGMAMALCLATTALAGKASLGSRLISLSGLLIGSLAFSLSGHASAADPQWLTRPLVYLHVLTFSAWVGALIPLAVAMKSPAPAAFYTLRRFSRVIPYAVTVLAAAGVGLATIQVREPSALAATAYGQVLIVKLALVATLLVMAAVNRWLLSPAAGRDAAWGKRALLNSIIAETCLVLVVLGTAALWRFTPPPRALQTVQELPLSIHLHSDAAMAQVTITPQRAGTVSISADIVPVNAQEASFTFTFTFPAAGVEPIRRKARQMQNGAWTIEGLILPVSGRWKVRLDILINDFEMKELRGEIEIAR